MSALGDPADKVPSGVERYRIAPHGVYARGEDGVMRDIMDGHTLDAAADGNFGGKHDAKPSINRRAGYGDRLYWAMRQAKKGGTLAAGEGLAIIEYYEQHLAAVEAERDKYRAELKDAHLVIDAVCAWQEGDSNVCEVLIAVDNYLEDRAAAEENT